MVNSKKWEKIEHEDVKLGDELKIVWTKERTGLTTKEIHKGRVNRVDGNHDFYLNGVGWEPGEPFDGTSTTIYRRIPEAFVFPTGKAAMISGTGSNNATVELIHIGGERWFSVNNKGIYSAAFLTGYLTNIRVLTVGIS